MTFDPRGQGRSDNRTPDGEMGSNANPDVFATNLIDAIDFFHSTPAAPYEGNVAGDPREVTATNPLHALVDRDRLGAVGHSLGARGVSVVQGAQPWPGSGETNPIDVIVAWDNLALSAGAEGDGLAGIPLVPRVPAMGQSGDYFRTRHRPTLTRSARATCSGSAPASRATSSSSRVAPTTSRRCSRRSPPQRGSPAVTAAGATRSRATSASRGWTGG
jgi:hypothetical protein